MGALIGTIGAVAAARRERDYYYERPYYGPGYGYTRARQPTNMPSRNRMCSITMRRRKRIIISTRRGRAWGFTPTDSSAVRCKASPASIHPLLRGPIPIRAQATAACRIVRMACEAAA